MSQEDAEIFVACYPGPIYRSASDLPPPTPPAESSTSDTNATAVKTITLSHNTGPIYICDNMRIVGESIDTPHTNENIPEMSTPEQVHAKKREADNSFGVHVNKRAKEEITKVEGTPTSKKYDIKRKIIQQHILSYKLMRNPDGSKYLPKRLTQDAMLKDYISKNPDHKCCKSMYVEQLKEMRISRHRSKSCTSCFRFEEELRKYEELNRRRSEHNAIAKEAINQYTQDRRLADTIENTKYYSIALEDEILLPEMPSSDHCHVSRLVVFNLTLAPINVSKSKAPSSYCMMWHEALAAAEESTIIDALVNFFENNRNIKNFVIWADDRKTFKNWTLFTALTKFVNFKDWEVESIHIKYISNWHKEDSQYNTLAADSLNKSIENSIKRAKEIFDFNAMAEIVKNSKKNLEVLKVTQFRNWPKDKLKDSKLTDLLQAMVEVKFERGSRKLSFTNNFKNNKDSFEKLDFLDDKFNVTSLFPKVLSEDRGVLKEKKDTIISSLVQSMPEATKSFWINLPENENSEDLMTVDHEE